MTVATTVPGVLDKLVEQLDARPGLAGVAVYGFDLGQWADAEAIALSRAEVTGTRWQGLGRLTIVESAQLSGYLFTQMADQSNASCKLARARAGVLWGELAQQVRDDPNIGGALSVAAGVRIPLRAANHTWTTWLASPDELAVTRVRVDFTFVWEATS